MRDRLRECQARVSERHIEVPALKLQNLSPQDSTVLAEFGYLCPAQVHPLISWPVPADNRDSRALVSKTMPVVRAHGFYLPSSRPVSLFLADRPLPLALPFPSSGWQ